MELLRFATIGSVDDGKSTLIGRLLHDSKQLFDDTLAAVALASERRGREGMDLSLVTDGLRAEREQGITIDVAYRYFATPRRKFVIADCPGHLRYTRNMATGASTAEVAVVLVDARHGLQQQTRRHLCVASLLGVRRFVACINKMDLVDWREDAFDAIVDDFLTFTSGLDVESVTPIPVSALLGDNVVERSGAAPWYSGPSLLELLEDVPVDPHVTEGGSRLAVQWVLRGDGAGHDRAYAGAVAGGVLRPGDDVVVLPSGDRSQVVSVETFDGPLEAAVAPLSVQVRLAHDLDVSRGDLIAAADRPARVTRDLEATVCWFADEPLKDGARLLLKHTTRTTPVIVRTVEGRLDVDTLELDTSLASLEGNDIGRVRLTTATALAVDPYRENRTTGSFVLIEEGTYHTVGAGLIA